MSFTKTQLPVRPAPPRSRRSIILAALIGFVLVNAAAAVAVKSVLRPGREETTRPAVVAPFPVSTEAEGEEEVDRARAHRLAGLDAMEHGDYDVAIHELTNAARVGDDTPELLRLISLAQDLRSRQASSPANPAEASPPAAMRTEVEQLIGAARRRTASTRRGSTSSRSSPGDRHARRGAETPVAPERVAPALVAPELDAPEQDPEQDAVEQDAVEPAAALAAAPAAAPGPVQPDVQSLAPASSGATAPSATAGRRLVPPEPPPPTRTFGDLEVLSPNVPGEVWVNGRNYGLAPRVVRGVPTGNARVEVRVDGVVRRSRVVRVREGQRSRVLLL